MRVLSWIWPRFGGDHDVDPYDGHLRMQGDINYYTNRRPHSRVEKAQRVTSTVFFVLIIAPLGILAFAAVVVGVLISATIVWDALT